MTKREFLTELNMKLQGLPEQDRVDRIQFYREMIDDRIEDGHTEEEAVAEIGSADEIVSQILTDYPLKKIVKESVKPSRALKAWEIVFLILGSPIWLSLLLVFFSVLLSVYVTLWSLILTLWAVDVALIACFLFGLISAVVCFIRGKGLPALAVFGAGLVCGGLAILLGVACWLLTKGLVKLTSELILALKSWLVGRRKEK